MANRIMLNETSYHGAGAIKEIATEVKARAFKKAFVCSDPDLIKFGVTGKVNDVLDEHCSVKLCNIRSDMFKQADENRGVNSPRFFVSCRNNSCSIYCNL